MQPFQLLVKPVSGRCNLQCSYCFYLDVPKRCYPDTIKPTMSDDILQKMIRSYLDFGFSPSVFSWQGGEPTLARLDFFKKAIELESNFGSKGQRIGNALQTNGIRIDSEWAQFLADYRFLVGLSIDGPKKIHDSARGKGSWRQAMNCADLLKEYGVQFSILTVIHRGNVKDARRIYRFHRDHNFKHLQFIPAMDVDIETGNLKQHSVRPKEYGEFLCELFDVWIEYGDTSDVSIRFFETAFENLTGKQATSLCTVSEHCGKYLVVEHNGDVYPCDFFVSPDNLLGNITSEPFTNLINRRSGFEWKKESLPKACAGCSWWRFCHGGCPKNRIHGDKSDLCKGYKLFFAHFEDKMGSSQYSI